MDIRDLLAVPANICAGMSEEEINREWDDMIARSTYLNRMEQGLLDGSLNRGEIEEFADLLAEHEIEPYAYLEAVQENVQFALSHVMD
jgi:hypothetical protein